MKVFKYLFFLILIGIIGLSIYISIQEDGYNISTSKLIKAPVEMVFEDVNEFKNWKNWSPWYEADPTIVASYPKQTSGVGGSYAWMGETSNGVVKTTALVTNREITQEVNFDKDKFAKVYWNFEEKSEGTMLTWSIKGKNSFIEKAFTLFTGGLEKKIKPMQYRGLELFSQYIEKEMNKTSFEHIGMVEYGGGYYLYQTTSCRTDEISFKMAEMFKELNSHVAERGVFPSGKPFTLTHKWDEENKTSIFSACIPVKEKMRASSTVSVGWLPNQKTFKTIYKGNYHNSHTAWESAFTTLEEQGFELVEKGEPFEVYTINPNDTKNPTKWITEIYIPIK